MLVLLCLSRVLNRVSGGRRGQTLCARIARRSGDIGHFFAAIGEAADGSFKITFSEGKLEWFDV